MPTRPRKPALRERHDRKRQALAESAAAVFAARGYERTTVADLASELGLATGAIYHYFPGKEQILLEICDQLVHPLIEAVEHSEVESDDPDERLRELVRRWVAHVIEHRNLVLVFTQVRHLVDHGEEWAGVRRSRKDFETLLEAALAELPDATPQATRLRLYALLGAVNHTVQWYRPRGPLSPQEIADGYTRLAIGRD
jgi:AcrR family transcriptional regulator